MTFDTPSILSQITQPRRVALKSLATGFGYLAFAGLAQNEAARAAGKSDSELAPKPTHFVPKAKRVIFLCMNGGPSHVDLFDHKPMLAKQAGNDTRKNGPRMMPSPFKFSQHGQSGHWFSDVCPNVAKHADDICMIHSMQTELPNHSQAFTQLHTGSFQFTRPSMGAWTVYGLGTENTDLPGFITLNPPSDNGGARNYGTSFLPSIFQATKIGTNQIPRFYAKLMGVDQEPGPPLKNIRNLRISPKQQRRQLDLIRELNSSKLKRDVHHPEIEGAIETFELAFRMQNSVPALLDLKSEQSFTFKSYGIGSGLPTDRFGRQCLLARRMAEAGVRFIELTAPVGWDHHFDLKGNLTESCAATDQPVAALLADLKERDMLKDTLVIWAGEFGRTPYAQSGTGRDHNNKGFTTWMAGGGVKGGTRYGSTDEFGHKAIENPVSIHDWHATILHLLGLDHERLTFNYAGRDFRLTDVYGDVVNEIIS